MTSSQRNILTLLIISFFMLVFYVGFYNYFQANHSEKKFNTNLLLIGFRYSRGILIYSLVAVLFSFVGNYYLNKYHATTSIFKIAIMLSTIILVLLFIIRTTFYIASHKRISTGIFANFEPHIFFFPIFTLVILPIVFFLTKSRLFLNSH